MQTGAQSPRPPAPMVGSTVSHYRITRELGKGGMGVVYEAQDTELPRLVALKFCSAVQDPQLISALLKEARALCSLKHPNIAEVHELGQTTSGQPFIVMELLPGELKVRGAPLTGREAVRVVIGVANALNHAHGRGITHRDIKPSNIRFTETGQLKVTDFGLAGSLRPPSPEDASRTITMEDVRRGTPGFMAPEVIRGGVVDGRSDLFSLGCVLYECLTGSTPFRGETVEVMHSNVLHLEPPPPSQVKPGVNPALDRITLKLLEKKPENRFQSAGEVAAALEALDSLVAPVQPRARVNRRPLGWGAVVVIAAASIALALWMWRPVHRPPPEAMRPYQKGLISIADGSYFTAAKRLQEAIRLDPDFTMAHAHLAEAWDELEDSDRAKDELLAASPPRAPPRLSKDDALHLAAIHATVVRDLDKAAKLFKELSGRVRGTDQAEALLDLGRVYDRAENRPAAAKAYEGASRADPQLGAPFLRLGAVYVTLREPEKAEAALSSAEGRYQQDSNFEGLAECLYQRGRLENNSVTSLEILDRALRTADLAKNQPQKIKILLLKADRLQRTGNGAKAVDAAREAQVLARTSGLKNLETRCLLDYGRTVWLRGDSAQGRQIMESALADAQRQGSKKNEARAKANLAGLLEFTGKNEEALPLAQGALEFYRSGQYRSETAQMLVVIAGVKEKQGDYDGALTGYRDAIRTIGEGARSATLAQAEEYLANLYLTKEDYPAARKWFSESRAIAASLGNKKQFAAATAGAAEVEAWLGHDSEARRLLKEGEDTVGRSSEYLERAAGSVDLAAGRYGPAVEKLRRAVEDGKNGDPAGQCAALTSLGLALVRSGQQPEASDMSTKAMHMAAEQQDAELQSSAALAMAESFIARGKRNDAAAVLRKVLPYFQAKGKKESEWYLWALLANAESGADYKEAAAHARDIYNQLTATWDSSDVQGYSSRPDIHKLRKALDSTPKG